MDIIRLIAVGYAVALIIAAALNYVPGLTDAAGARLRHLRPRHLRRPAAPRLGRLGGDCRLLVALGVDHVPQDFSARSTASMVCFGLVTGSGYLDLGILIHGVQNLPFGFKILANLPHLALGGFAAFAGFVLAPRTGTA